MKKASLDRGSNASETKKQRESLQESNDVMPLWPPPCDEALPEGQNDEDQLVAAVVECLLLEKQQRTERTLQKVSDVCRTTKEIGKELNEERKRVAEEKLLPNSSWVQIKLYFQYSLLTQFLVAKFAVN